jgi:hypothetical protein
MKKITLLSLCVMLNLVVFAQVDLNKGLVLYLPFNGNTLDASPNANHATNYGATLTADQWGNPNRAYRFDGKTNYMRIPNATSLQCDTQITLCARVKVQGFYNGICYGNSIIDKGYPDFIAGNYNLRFIASNNISESCSFKDTTQHNYYGSFYDQIPVRTTRNNIPYVKPSEWDCLVYTYDGITARMYVNGILRHSYTCAYDIGVNTQDLLLGRHGNPTYPYWFNGIMDEVRIYNRALNTLEIDSVCSKSNPQSNAIYEVQRAEVLPILSNPVNNQLVLSLSADKMGGTLIIVDMSGRKLISIASLKQNIIALDAIPSGVYMLSYQIGNSYMRTRMIKQ